MCFPRPGPGSTLLRAILGSHSELYAPPELPLRHLGVRAETKWIRASLEGLELTTEDVEHMLWDRVLAEALRRSGKPTIVVKTPANVLSWERIAACWPDARFIFLLRHPAAAVASLQSSFDPAWQSSTEAGSLEESVAKGLRYMTALDQAREALPGFTVRYEDLTAEPERVVRELCEFLGVPFRAGHARLRGLRPCRVHSRSRRQLAEHQVRPHPAARAASRGDTGRAGRDLRRLGVSASG